MVIQNIRLDIEPQQVLPTLFIVDLACVIKTDVYSFMYYGLAYSSEQAQVQAIDELRIKKYQLYAEVKQRGGTWKAVKTLGITVSELEHLFSDNADMQRVARTKHINKLMGDILVNKDIALMHQNIKEFTSEQLQYLHDILTYGNTDNR